MTTLYHGTSFQFDTLQAGNGCNTDVYDANVDAGVFLTTDQGDAMWYAQRSAELHGGEARLVTCTISDEARVLVYDDDLAERFEDTDAALVELAEDGGYDAIDFDQGGSVNTAGTWLILNLDILNIKN